MSEVKFVPHTNWENKTSGTVTKTKEIPCLTGKGEPTTATVGAVGCWYMDTDSGAVYKCSGAADGVYTWDPLLDKDEIKAVVDAYLAANSPEDGEDGGHYKPVVTQPTKTTMKVEFEPSKAGMPAVDPVTVELPIGEDSGQNAALTSNERSTLIAIVNAIGTFSVPNGQELMNAFNAAWGNSGSGDDSGETEKTLTSISATYSGGSVAVGTAVSALTGVVVTAHYSDGTSATVTGYTLSGTIDEGDNTVTVTYEGQTATFVVVGVAESGGDTVYTNTIFPLADGTSSDGMVVVANNHVTISTANRTVNLTDVTEDANIDTGNAYQMYAGKSYTLTISNYTNEGANYYKTIAIRGNDGTDIYKNDKVTGDGAYTVTPETDCTATCIYFVMNQGSKVEFDVSFMEVTA